MTFTAAIEGNGASEAAEDLLIQPGVSGEVENSEELERDLISDTAAVAGLTGLSLSTVSTWFWAWYERAKLRNGKFKVILVGEGGERHVLYGTQEEIAAELKKLGEFLEKTA